MKTYLTFGVFDLFHYGHKELFRRIKEELGGPGSRLVVAVHEDDWVRRFKPDCDLVYSMKERMEMVAQCRYVDEVVTYKSVDMSVKELDFDVFVIGADQGAHPAWQDAMEWCRLNGKEMVRLPRTEGVSSSVLRDRIRHLS